MTLTSDSLKTDCEPIWNALHSHAFIEEMVAGTLPERKFAYYIGQNILYLGDLARTAAIGVAKAEDEGTMRAFSRFVANILDYELPENRELLARVRSIAPDAGDDPTMAPATLAYTRHLLTVAYTGRAVDIFAAITPCVWSYGEIGKQRIDDAPDHPVYGEWISFFAGRQYWQTVSEVTASLDTLSSELSGADAERVRSVFRTSSRMEHRFWDMAYNEDSWLI